jgi:uncharacterized protein (TIGR02246 family)
MNRRVPTAVCRMAGLALLVACVAQAAPQAQASPDAEFQKIADAFSAAWNKGDAKGIAALHTKDGLRVGGTGETAVVGAAAIEAAMTAALTGPFKGTRLTIKSNSYKRLAADTYVGEGTYSVEGGTPPPGTPLRGQYMNVMTRQGGRWLIAASAVIPATPPQK